MFGRQKSTKVNRKEQIRRQTERVDELRKELNQLRKENRDWQRKVTELKQDLELQQSSNEARGGADLLPILLIDERDRMEIERMQQHLEQITSAKQLMESKWDYERTLHKEQIDRLSGRIEELENEQKQLKQDNMQIGHLSHEISLLKKIISGSNLRGWYKYFIVFPISIFIILTTHTDIIIALIRNVNSEISWGRALDFGECIEFSRKGLLLHFLSFITIMHLFLKGDNL